MKTIFQLNKDELGTSVLNFIRTAVPTISANAKVRFNCRVEGQKILELTADVTDEPAAPGTPSPDPATVATVSST